MEIFFKEIETLIRIQNIGVFYHNMIVNYHQRKKKIDLQRLQKIQASKTYLINIAQNLTQD